MKAWFKFSAALFLAQLASFQASATDVGYELEVIIFEDTSGLYEYAEQWPTLQEVTEIAEASPMAAETDSPDLKNIGKPDQYQLLKPDNYRLNSQAEKLAKHPDYRVLIHAAWKQAGLDRDQAFAVPLESLPATTTRATDKTQTSTASTDINSRITAESRACHIQNRYLVFINKRIQNQSSFKLFILILRYIEFKEKAWIMPGPH